MEVSDWNRYLIDPHISVERREAYVFLVFKRLLYFSFLFFLWWLLLLVEIVWDKQFVLLDLIVLFILVQVVL